MLLIYLILGSVMLFQSGMFWSAYRIDLIDDRPNAVHRLYWSIGLGLFGLYFLICMIGRASTV